MIRETTAEDIVAIPAEDNTWARDRLIAGGDCRTIVADGEPIALFGVTHIGPGVGHVWVNVARGDHRRHARHLVRCARLLAEAAMRHYRMHRLQTVAPSDDEKLGRWLGLCGFTPEAVLTMAGPAREDMTLFVILKGH